MSDGGESARPTLDDLWRHRSAEAAFPAALVQDAQTVGSFFSASFYGRNDVIFLNHLKVPDILLVDTDRLKLAAMAKIYPAVLETYAEDAYEVAERLHGKGRTFDVVITDPFDNQSLRVLREHFDTFSNLALHAWVTGVGLGSLQVAGIEPTIGGVQSWLDEHGRGGWEVVWLEIRNASTGLAWLGLRRRVSPRERGFPPDLPATWLPPAADQPDIAPTTLAEIWAARSARGAFPSPSASGARTAASFFSAAYYGTNDVIYLHRLGLSEILINDIDEHRLDVMARLYPEVTEAVAGDAFECAERLAQQGRVFDIVVCDSFAGLGWYILDERFDTFAALTRRSLLVTQHVSMLASNGVQPTVAGMQAFLNARGRTAWQITSLELRNAENGSVWAAFERRSSRPAGPSAT